MVLEIIFIMLLLVFSGFFSGSETALTTASDALMERQEEKGNKKASMVKKLRLEKNSLISTILLGNNIVNILATSLTTSVLVSYYGDDGVLFATLIMTFLVLIFSEILPKSYAVTHSNTFALAVAPIMSVLVFLLHPIVKFLQYIVDVFLKMLPEDGMDEDEEEELRGAIDLHQKDDKEFLETRHMLHSILDLQEINVTQVMTHRKHIVAINLDANMNEILKIVCSSSFTFIPCYTGSIKNIIGVLNIKNLFQFPALNQITKEQLKDILEDPWFMLETTSIEQQLQEFKANFRRLSLVVDEYGELLGCVSLSDVLEEIVGTLDSKKDKIIPDFILQPDGSIIAEGTAPVREINREYNWHLPDEDIATIAGLVLHEVRRIPVEGQKFIINNYRIDILERTNNQITKIRIYPQSKTPK